jgi:hypothetical protein
MTLEQVLAYITMASDNLHYYVASVRLWLSKNVVHTRQDAYVHQTHHFFPVGF